MGINKGTPRTPDAVLVGTRIPPEVRDQFAEVARRNSRSMAGELRWMIEQRVDREMATDALESAA